MSLLIRNARNVVCSPERIMRFSDVLMEGDRITAVGQNLPVPSDARTIDATDCVVIPGLINAHTHLYQSFLKGTSQDLPLTPWCSQALFPTVGAIRAEFSRGNFRPAYLWSALAAVEMIKGGTTCCLDMDMRAAEIFRAWQDIGIRGVAGLTLSNTWLPDELLPEEQELQVESLKSIEQWHRPDGTIQVFLAPSAPFLCDDKLLTWTRDISAEMDLGVQIHVAETEGEVADSFEEWGMHPVGRLHRLEMLNPRLSAVHCVHVGDQEIRTLAEAGVTVVHCPKSNMKLADGAAPLNDMLESGIHVALGTDGAASNDLLDMWEEMRSAVLLARVTRDRADALSAADAFRMATEGAARACRIEAGRIEPGRLADLAIIDLNGPHLRPVHDILNTLVFCTRADDVRDTIVAGQVVMEHRRLTNLDEANLLQEADEVGRQLYARRADFRYDADPATSGIEG